MKSLFLRVLLPLLCEASDPCWKEKKYSHQGSKISKDSAEGLKQLTQELADEENFSHNLDRILIPRTVGSDNLTIVRQHIIAVMNDNGWSVKEDSFRDNTPHGMKQFTNVIATRDPLAARRLVIACHYESKIDPPGVYATDSAVPCAMMLNLATTMRNLLSKRRSDLTLQFIFFDGEEAFDEWSDTDSLYGSRHLAAKWEKQRYTSGGATGNQNDRIDLLVLLDLLGAGNMQIWNHEESGSRWYERMVSIETNMWYEEIINEVILTNRQGPRDIEDDHIPFKKRGVPILHLIATPFPKVWHKINDNKANLDFGKIEHFNKILRTFVAEYLGLLKHNTTQHYEGGACVGGTGGGGDRGKGGKKKFLLATLV